MDGGNRLRRKGSHCSTRHRYRSPGIATGAPPSPTPGPLLPLPDRSDRGEPGAWRRARRVRRAAWGNGPRVIPTPRPRPTQPEKAIVLCMDEKSQIQALDRTQASLPMTPGRAGTMTHDYKRNGTTTLFAALDVLTGTVIGQCLPRHRHTEFIKFLNTIDREVPDRLQVHLILDNYATHKHSQVQKWMKRHKRFHFHFTPTSSSWLNQVERWFRDLTDKNLRRGIFASVPELLASSESYLNAHNADPKPYVWTATAESILAKVRRARTKLQQVVNQN